MASTNHAIAIDVNGSAAGSTSGMPTVGLLRRAEWAAGWAESEPDAEITTDL